MERVGGPGARKGILEEPSLRFRAPDHLNTCNTASQSGTARKTSLGHGRAWTRSSSGANRQVFHSPPPETPGRSVASRPPHRRAHLQPCLGGGCQIASPAVAPAPLRSLGK